MNSAVRQITKAIFRKNLKLNSLCYRSQLFSTSPIILQQQQAESLKNSESSNHANPPEELEEPVAYSQSDLARRASDETFTRKSNAPRYQHVSVFLSTAVFLIYFCYLREENDIDEYLGDEVFPYMDPFKEAHSLKHRIQVEKANGKDTTQLQLQLEKVNDIINTKVGDYSALENKLQRLKAEKQSRSGLQTTSISADK